MAGKLIPGGYGRYRLVQNADINVTPFVDIMLVLLIIFMIALPVAQVSLRLDLPPPAASASPVHPTIVTLRKDGGVLIGDVPSSLDRLSSDLAQRIGGAHPMAERVYVRGERGVRYGAFVGLLSRLHHDGFQSVGLVSEEAS